MQVEISVSKTADEWFKSMPKKQQEAYIKQHPNSKYARQAKKAEEQEDKGKTKKTDAKSKRTVPQKHVKKLQIHWKKFSKDQRKLFHDGGHLPKSKERSSFADMMRRKKAGIAKAIKHEVHEWKQAGNAVKKLVTGKTISKHEKQALKSVAIHVGLVVGPMALSGGLSAGLAATAKGLGFGLLEHTALIRGAQIAAFASESKDKPETPEDYLTVLVGEMADAMEDADISIDSWIKAAEEGAEGVEAS